MRRQEEELDQLRFWFDLRWEHHATEPSEHSLSETQLIAAAITHRELILTMSQTATDVAVCIAGLAFADVVMKPTTSFFDSPTIVRALAHRVAARMLEEWGAAGDVRATAIIA